MGAIDTLANTVYRDYVTNGAPNTGDHEPVLREIRELFSVVQSQVDLMGAMLVADNIFISGNDPPTNLNHGSGTYAIVLSGDEDEDGKVYIKSGGSGSGSWGYVTRILTNPASLEASIAALETALDARIDVLEDFGGGNYLINEVYLENTAEETRIEADTFTTKTTRERMDVYVLQMQEDNLGPVTELLINAFGTAALLTSEGDPLKPRDVRGGEDLYLYWTGGHYRVMSDPSALLLRRNIDPRDDDRLLVTGGQEDVSVELDPQGVLQAAAIDAGSVSGVAGGAIRRMSETVVASLPMSLGFHIFGQSNALANKATPAISTQRSGYNLKTANGGVRTYEYPGTDAERWDHLIDHVESDTIETDIERGETAGRGWAEAFFEMAATHHGLRHWSRTAMGITSANGQGSSTIEQLRKGTDPYTSFMKDIEFAGREASDLGFQHYVHLLWLDQIEANVEAETVPATWKTSMRAFRSEVTDDIVDELFGSNGGPDPLIALKQMSAWTHYSKTFALAQAQLELVQESSSGFLLVPSYPATYSDGVHTTAEDQHGYFGIQLAWLHKMIALCGKTHSDLLPMAIVSNVRDGTDVYLEYRTYDGAEVVFDTQRVRYIENFGIQMYQSNGTTPITVMDVLPQPRGIVVRTSGIGSVTAGMKVRNGCNDTIGTGSGWDEGPRSNIRSTRGDEVQVRTAHGARRVDEWSVVQEFTLT